MILADTSVWLDHFRAGIPRLQEFLEEERVVMHPFVAGELACGNLSNRELTLRTLRELPRAAVASHYESMALLNERRLFGRGLGWVDVNLLASVLLTGCLLWTFDRPLADAARSFKVEYA